MKTILIQKLINSYENALSNVVRMSNMQEAKTFLSNIEMDYGICRYSKKRLYTDIYYDEDMKMMYEKLHKERILFGSLFWYKYPAVCENMTEVIRALQFRLEKLKEILLWKK